MNKQADAKAILGHTSQPFIGAGFLAVATPESEPHNPPSATSPVSRFVTWQGMEYEGIHPAIWLTLSLLLQPEPWQTTGQVRCSLVAASLYIDALQVGVSVKRHSPVFSLLTLGHSLRCFSRALAARRCSASHYVRPAGLGFQRKNLPRLRPLVRGEIFIFGASTESTSRPWERGTSRRFAQECPEGNPGKYKQGETPWHSTKTKSL